MTDRQRELDEYVAELQASIGTTFENQWSPTLFGPDFPGSLEAFTTEFNRDAIRKYVDAVGDVNPLYRDPAHSAAAGWGAPLAPPTMLYGVAYGTYPSPAGRPPSNKFSFLYAGDEYEWFDVLREGDAVDWTTVSPTEVVVKDTRTEGRVPFVYGTHEFRRRSDQQVIARAKFWAVARPGRTGRPDDGYLPEYTEEYIRRIHEVQDREYAGPGPRYFEDVEIGAELAPVARGPHTTSETVAWILGSAGERFFFSSRMYRYIADHAGWGDFEPRWNTIVHHHEPTLSRTGRGFGAQRSAWAAMMVTNWMGDGAMLRRLRTEHRGQGHYGNVYWATGEVVGKRQEGDDALVDLQLRVVTQEDAEVLRGTATVALPTRTSPVVAPLARAR